jgi:hypothetical protein
MSQSACFQAIEEEAWMLQRQPAQTHSSQQVLYSIILQTRLFSEQQEHAVTISIPNTSVIQTKESHLTVFLEQGFLSMVEEGTI